MTYPESIIRNERNIEYVGKWIMGNETTEWDVPISWFEFFDPENNLRMKFTDTVLKLVYTLDFLLHFAFDDYDLANTYD